MAGILIFIKFDVSFKSKYDLKNMELLQNILMYLTLGIAVFFLVKKYLWPKKKTSKSCGQNDCGCH